MQFWPNPNAELASARDGTRNKQNAGRREEDTKKLSALSTAPAPPLPVDNKENNGSSPRVSSLRSAQPRGLAARGARVVQVLPQEPTPQHSVDAIKATCQELAEKSSAAPSQVAGGRRARALRRATAKGDDAVDVEISFAGALDTYAPPERPSEASGRWRVRWPTDSRRVVFFETNDQLKANLESLLSAKK